VLGVMGVCGVVWWVCVVRCGGWVWLMMDNSIILLDNAIIHHQPRFVQALEAIGVLVVWLSPYSPDYSAIELCFKQLKDWLKRHREQLEDDPACALVEGMANVTPANMAGYFRHCHYPVPAVEEEEEAVALFVVTAAAAVA
jgi:hypothetical protein